jgi:zinc transport system substrate-binding protein
MTYHNQILLRQDTMIRALPAVVVFVAVVLATLPCSAEPIPVVVSIPPQEWLVKAVGGDLVKVMALLGPGDSPATFQPTDAQVTGILSARLFFRIGVPFESGAWFKALSASRLLDVVDGREGVRLLTIQGEDSLHGHDASVDPHIWLSPRRLKDQARTVANALFRVDPTNKETYTKRLESVLILLEELDREVQELLAPYAGRSFVVFHPSWGYFAHDYGLRQVAIENEGKEPTDRELTLIQKLARDQKLRIVFVQPQIRGRSAQAVADALGLELGVLDPLSADLPGNLRSVAEKLLESFGP